MVCQLPYMQHDETIRKGPWLEEEDERLVMFVTLLGERRWDSLARVSGLKRSGKSCRLRWLNYLRPNLKHGPITEEEKTIILHLHALWGNKWSKIARRLPGRTDNEIKNYWRTYSRKKAQIQECGNLCNKGDDTREYFLNDQDNEIDTRIQEHEPKDHMKEINQENFKIDKKTSDDDIPEMGNVDFMMNSPYETRISHWISEMSMDHRKVNLVENHGNNCTVDVNSTLLQEIRDLEEICCSLWT